MLEHQRLLIGPWIPACGQPPVQPQTEGAGEPMRRIFDSTTGSLLGFASIRSVFGYCRLFRTSMLEVHEAEDEPLLFTSRCTWGWTRRWLIHDADGGFVGMLRRRSIHDARGRVATIVDGVDCGATTCFRDLRGQTLGMLHKSGEWRVESGECASRKVVTYTFLPTPHSPLPTP